jgi:hypothetical protein
MALSGRPLKPEDARGKWEKEYLDPKTSQKRRKELWKLHGLKNGWASIKDVDQYRAREQAKTTTPPVEVVEDSKGSTPRPQPAGSEYLPGGIGDPNRTPGVVTEDPDTGEKKGPHMELGEDLPDKKPPSETTIGAGATQASDSDAATSAAKDLFDEQFKQFQAGLTLAGENLPEIKLNEELTRQQQDAINYARDMAAALKTLPQDAVSALAAQEALQKQAARMEEDPRMLAILDDYKRKAEMGLSSPELTALRESGLMGMNEALGTALRQSKMGAAGRGISGAAMGAQNPAILNAYLQQRRGLENDVRVQDIGYRSDMLDKYGTLANTRNNELWGRNETATKGLTDAVNNTYSNYWGAQDAANKTFAAATDTAAKYQSDQAKWNAEQAYGRMGDILSTGVSGAGWAANQDYIDKALKLMKEQIEAQKSIGGGGDGINLDFGSLLGSFNNTTSGETSYPAGDATPRSKIGTTSGVSFG